MESRGRTFRPSWISLLLLILAFAFNLASPQSGTGGSIGGQVADKGGRLFPALVTLRNTATGAVSQVFCDDAGNFLNVAPAVLEDRLRSHALISQTMVVGDSRPYISALITLDPEALGPWKARHGKPADATIASLRDDPDLLADVQAAVDDANQAVSRAESIRRFRILDDDFTVESGQLSAKLGIRRSVLVMDYAGDIDALYA
jgi:long-chain acyl-CoA synthetase